MHVRIIGYSEDDEPIRAIFKHFTPKTKKERNAERQKALFSKEEPLEFDEWFIYKVDGEKWYYKIAQDIEFLKTHHKEVLFLGIGRPNEAVHRIPNMPSEPYKSPKKEKYAEVYKKAVRISAGKTKMYSPFEKIGDLLLSNNAENGIVFTKTHEWIKITDELMINHPHKGKCCYCRIDLYRGLNYTKDHIIPKHKGGKITKPSCYKCNQEKGGMDLPVYIQYLCFLQSQVQPKTEEYRLLQTKIVSANKIAIEISKA